MTFAAHAKGQPEGASSTATDDPSAELVDFLLARITEDEAAWSGGLGLATRTDFATLSQHMLADCTAKRRIVELEGRSRRRFRTDVEVSGTVEVHGWSDEGHTIWVGGEKMTDEEYQRITEPEEPPLVLRLLAEAYAWHPDFQSEWRVP